MDDWLMAPRVRVALWHTLGKRAIDAVGSEGPHSGIVRNLCRTIYDEVASEKLRTAESIATSTRRWTTR